MERKERMERTAEIETDILEMIQVLIEGFDYSRSDILELVEDAVERENQE